MINDFIKIIIIDKTYLTILKGLMNTLYISFFGFVLSIIIGSIILFLRRSKNSILANFAKIYIAFFKGTPVLMLLLLLYYVIFGNSDIDPITVAIITFGINTSSYIAELMNTTIDTIDAGEIDAARTLGFTKFGTILYVIIPQSIKRAKPVIESTAITLVQWTSVVGYIAITDLTRIINQISSRTMKPILLITIGMILYLLIAYLIKFIFFIIDLIKSKKYILPDTKIKKYEYKNIHTDKETPVYIEKVDKSFGKLEIFNALNFQLKTSEVVTIIGPSGEGKSVFLRLCIGLMKPDAGNIYIYGKDIVNNKVNIDKIRENIGYVYQNFNLFSNMNVLENLILAPTKLKNISKNDAINKALSLLNMLGLKNHIFSSVSDLSGGQKQRIAIARCLMMNPDIILMDEPTSALDPSMTGEIIATIRMLKKYGITMLIVTHDMNLARKVSDRVCFISEKHIYDEGNVDEILNYPKKELTVAFIENLKNFDYHIEDIDFDILKLIGKMTTFIDKYGIDQKNAYRLNLIVEEIISELTILYRKKNRKSININLSCEYSDVTKEININFNYDGEEYNIFDIENMDENHLGIIIVKNSCKNYSYKHDKNGKNTIKITL